MNSHPEISQDTIELIESYLLKQMPESERRVFEERLKTDSVLQHHVDEIRLITMAVQEKSLRQNLDRFHTGIINPEQTAGTQMSTAPVKAIVRNMAWKKWISVAAVLMIIATSAWWLLLKPNRDQQLFADYFQPDPGLMTTMGGTDEYEFNRAMIDYKSAHYNDAITRWNKLLAATPNSDTLHYFIASAQLANKNFTEALRHFKPVTDQPSSAFYSEACWYAGLAALHNADKPSAAKYLSQSGRPEKEKLLAELNR